MSELVVACKALPDFNTLQIVRLPNTPSPPGCNSAGSYADFYSVRPMEWWEQILKEHLKYLEDWTIDCLKKPKTGRLEREGRRWITLRIIEFGHDHYPSQRYARVKEYEV